MRVLPTFSPAGSSGFLSLFKGLAVGDRLTGSKLYCWSEHGQVDGWGHSLLIHVSVLSSSPHSLTLTHQAFIHQYRSVCIVYIEMIHPLFMHLSPPSTQPQTHPTIHWLTQAPIHSSAYLPIFLSLSIRPTIYLPLYSPVHPFIHSSSHAFTGSSTLSSINILIYTTVHPFKNPLADIDQASGHW